MSTVSLSTTVGETGRVKYFHYALSTLEVSTICLPSCFSSRQTTWDFHSRLVETTDDFLSLSLNGNPVYLSLW